MVVARVEIAEHLPCEVWDVLRITTGDMRIGQAWEQCLADGAVDRGVRSGERALHLIEDDALVAEAAVGIGWVLELVADSLLLECVFAQEREEGSVFLRYIATVGNRGIANRVPVVPCRENLMEVQLARPVVGNEEKDTTKV